MFMLPALSTPLPLISVVMATYNGERFLREQLDSILNQTYPNLEIVAVDDASQDGTLAILNEYGAVYPNVRVYDSEKNRGYIKNFERGLELCAGDFVAFSDQDDIWLPEKLSVLFHAIDGQSLAYCNSELIDGQGHSLGVRLSDIKNHQNFWTPLNFVVGSSASGHAMLVRKAALELSLPLPTLISHDYWVGFVATLTGPIRYVDEVLVLYRQHSSNVIGVTAKGMRASPKTRLSGRQRRELNRQRIHLFCEKCPEGLAEKEVFRAIHASYKDFSVRNNWRRLKLFMKYRREITAYKRRNALRQWLFGLKMFFKVI